MAPKVDNANDNDYQNNLQINFKFFSNQPGMLDSKSEWCAGFRR